MNPPTLYEMDVFVVHNQMIFKKLECLWLQYKDQFKFLIELVLEYSIRVSLSKRSQAQISANPILIIAQGKR